MNIFSMLATMALYGIFCIIVPAVTGGLTLLLIIWRRTRLLGIGVLLAGSAAGLLIGGLMEVSSLLNHSASGGPDFLIGGAGSLAGFGIGAGAALAIGLPIFLFMRFTQRAMKPQPIT